MTTSELLDHLRAEAMKLPEPERLVLARALEASVVELDTSPELAAEIDRRLASLDDGSAQLVSSQELLKEAQQRFGR